MISKLLQSILDYYFKTDTIIIPCSEIEEIDILKDKGVVVLEELTNYKIITRSSILLDYLYTLINKHNSNFATKLADVEQFFNTKREEIPSAQWNSFKELEDSYIIYLFYNLFNEKGIDTYEYFLRLPNDDKYIYEEQFYESLFYAKINTESLYRILSSLDGNEFHGMSQFCTKFAKESRLNSLSLYEYTLSQPEHSNHFYILSNLLLGFFHIDNVDTLQKAKYLLGIHPTAAISAIARFEYSQVEEVQDVYLLVSTVNTDIEDMPIQLAYLYKSIIENPVTSENIRISCFSQLENLFTKGDDNVRNSIFNNCRSIKGFEPEKYRFFVDVILSKSQKYYSRINDFFRNFSNPDYFFELLSYLYLVEIKYKRIPNVSLFVSSYSQFAKNSPERTKERILELISHDVPFLRLAAVKLITSVTDINNHFYIVDLLSLDSNVKQLRASEALFKCSYHNIDSVVSLIMTLSKSKNKDVVNYIQNQFTNLIFESYHGYLLELIQKHTKDQTFINPIKKKLEEFEALCKQKEEFNDLNPYENERDWMKLYRQLEQEQFQLQMNKLSKSKDSFLSTIKETIIVRGHSWQVGDNDVSPLHNIQHSTILDMRLFRDSDSFNRDFQEYNFISKF